MLKPMETDGAGWDRADTNRTEPIETEIEGILATEEELVPSSGFLAATMERVMQEAAMPAPMPFPWKRTLPGILILVVIFAWGGYKIVPLGLPALGELTVSAIPFAPPHLSAAMEQSVEGSGWVALALGASLLSWLLSKRIVGRSGLL